MSFKRILYSQALDNKSSNSILADGVWLNEKDEHGREQAMSVVSMVVETGQTVKESDGLKVIKAPRGGIIIEYACLDRDVAGRTSFIVFCDRGGGFADQEPSEQTQEEVAKFADKIGRKLLANSLAILPSSPPRLKRRWKARAPVVLTAIGLVAIMAATVVLFSNSHSLQRHKDSYQPDTVDKRLREFHE